MADEGLLGSSNDPLHSTKYKAAGCFAGRYGECSKVVLQLDPEMVVKVEVID